MSSRNAVSLTMACAMILTAASLAAPVAAAPPDGTPLHPLLGWTLAGDGTVYVLDARYRIWQLAAVSLEPLRHSEHLVPIVSSTGRGTGCWNRRTSPTDLISDGTRLIVGGGLLTQTLILDEATFAPIATLDVSGPIAAASPARLFTITPASENTGSVNQDLWMYDLADVSLEPTLVYTSTRHGGPIGIGASPDATRLYVEVLSTPGTSPRNSTCIVIYDTGPMTRIGCMSDSYSPFYYLRRPVPAQQAHRIFTTAHSGHSGVPPYLLVFDFEGEFVEGVEHLGGVLAANPDGEWFYLLRERGLWVVRGDDFALQSVLPFTTHAPADMLISHDADTLYLLGNGWLTAVATAELQTAGIVPVSPLPEAWGEPVLYQPREPGPVDTRFAQYDREVYRSDDGGATWGLLPVFRYPDYVHVQALSVSPDYATDRTLTVLSGSSSPIHRSTDGGETLEKWTPLIAFASDRDGDFDIYTMTPDGESIRPVTDDPANDSNPAWSPAWTRIAFQSDRDQDRGWDIYTVRGHCDPDAADAEERCDLRRLTDDPSDNVHPAWSPDGSLIAFVSTRDGNPELYTMRTDGSEQQRLTFDDGGDWQPVWLADGKHIVFTSDRDGQNELYLTYIPSQRANDYVHEQNIYLLTRDRADDRDPATGAGTSILFISDRDGFPRTYGMHIDYGRVLSRTETVTPESHPAYAANGSDFLVARERNGGSSIVYVDWREETQLTTSGATATQPSGGPVWWDPDCQVRPWITNPEIANRD